MEELEKLLGDQDRIVLSAKPPAPPERNGYGNKWRNGNGNGRYASQRPAAAPADAG